MPVTLSGSLSGDQLSLSDGGSLPCSTSVTAHVLPAEQVLDGSGVIFSAAACNPPFIQRVFATRCTCFDGNATAGDGCDPTCRVEPCWTCSGDPSTCTPIADGGACDDRRDCTTGTTCAAGACDGGATVPACIDLTGAWDALLTSSFTGQIPLVVDVVQELGVVVLRTPPAGPPWLVGTVDTSAGTMHLTAPSTAVLCIGAQVTFDGTATTNAFDGALVGPVQTPRFCLQDNGTLSAVRVGCGNGVLDPGESCDDGNQVPGDHCDASCQIEPVIDGCTVVPRGDCRASLDPSRSSLLIRDDAAVAKDVLTWNWKVGAATTVGEFGAPATSTDVALCVYDADDLRLSLRAPAGATCGTRPCWKPTSRGVAYADRTGAAHGLLSIKATAGAASNAKITVKAKGASLAPPAPPLALPVRVQLQVEDGVCFETRHDTAAVLRNQPGMFKARGVP
jgi:cysteine-rich repeat protein